MRPPLKGCHTKRQATTATLLQHDREKRSNNTEDAHNIPVQVAQKPGKAQGTSAPSSNKRGHFEVTGQKRIQIKQTSKEPTSPEKNRVMHRPAI